MPRRRSQLPRVLGMISIAHAVIAGVVLLVAALGRPFPGRHHTADLLFWFQVGMTVVLAALAFGQLNYWAWARKWSMVWGAAGLTAFATTSAVLAMMDAPVRQALVQSRLGLAMLLCLSPYPFLVVIAFSRETVAAAMTRGERVI